MSAPTILATTSSFASNSVEALELLQSHGFAVVTNPHGRKLSENELGELLTQHHPVGLLAGTEPVTDRVLRAASAHLKAISRIGVGWDNIDHAAAADLNIPVSRTEGVLDQPVAELTLAMILDACRHVSLHDRKLRNGEWKKRMGSLLSEKRVGILGFGAIGRRVGELCAAFGAQVLYCDPVARDSDLGVGCNLEDLLEKADVLTLHANGQSELLGREALERFAKPGAIIVNTARGGMANEQALFDLLKDGRIAFACLDVFAAEPYTGPLATLDNTILTPHIGSYAVEARIRMEVMATHNLLSALGV